MRPVSCLVATLLPAWTFDCTLTRAATESEANGADDRLQRYLRAPGGRSLGTRAEPRDHPPAADDPKTQAQPRDLGCYGTSIATRYSLRHNSVIASDARHTEPGGRGPVDGPRQPRASRAREVHRNVTARRLLCHSCRIRSPAPARAGGSFPIKHEHG